MGCRAAVVPARTHRALPRPWPAPSRIACDDRRLARRAGDHANAAATMPSRSDPELPTLDGMTASWNDPQLTGIGRLPMHSVPHARPARAGRDLAVPVPVAPRCRARRPLAGHHGPRRLDTAGHGRRAALHQRPDALPGPAAARPGHEPDRCPRARRSSCPSSGAASASCSMSVPPRASSSSRSTARTWASARTPTSRPSSTSPEYLVPGTNTLRLTVVKWSDANFVEDQDQWWQGGITRSVYLYATDAVHIADLRADAGLADDLTTGTHRPRGHRRRGPPAAARLDRGRPALRAWASTCPRPSRSTRRPWTTRSCSGRASERDLLWQVGAGEAAQRRTSRRPGSGCTPGWRRRSMALRAGRCGIPDILPWSAELPRLYDLAVTLRSPDGTVVEETSIKVGFRRIEIVGMDLLVNGRAGAVPRRQPP